jgi:hypothetical protein
LLQRVQAKAASDAELLQDMNERLLQVVEGEGRGVHAVVACVILCRCSTHRTSQALAAIDTLHAEQRPPSSAASNAPDRLLRSFSPPPHHATSFSLSNEKHLQELQEQVVESASSVLFPE